MSDGRRTAKWWRNETIYQIYPRSFRDCSADGVGDLAGIREQLPYLRELGIDALWLSPIFRSPMRDFGYDIADYCAIDPLFGTMDEFDALLADAHERGLKLLLDFVPNHTSDQHAWFAESRSSRDNPKRDWYIWRDPAGHAGGGPGQRSKPAPPNNWISNFGGPAWQFDEATGQFYYHAFLASQPDLNWRNPEVRAAMFDVMRFWLDKGVDGFRVDVIWHLIKDADLRDNPPNPDYRPGQPDIERNLQVHSADQPEIHELVAEMRKVVEEYDHRLLIGEIYLPLERLVRYYGHDGESGVHLPFNFQLLECPWHAATVADLIGEYEAALPDGGWPNWVLSNHDQPRIAARVGEARARVAAMLLLTLRGTPTIYYGDELGIADVDIPEHRVRDCWALAEADAAFNRDKARTPMQWSGEPHAGFSEVEPWLPLTGDWRRRNVATMAGDEQSLLALHRRLLALRRNHGPLRTGGYERLYVENEVLAYERSAADGPAGGREDERLGVFLNFSSEEKQAPLPERYQGAEVTLSTDLTRYTAATDRLTLGPDEGVIIRPAGGS